MLRMEDPQELHVSGPPPAARDKLPTLPCDLSEYARAHTGPYSWSAYCEDNPRELVLDDPFGDLFET
jgi:hypothetical protein